MSDPGATSEPAVRSLRRCPSADGHVCKGIEQAHSKAQLGSPFLCLNVEFEFKKPHLHSGVTPTVCLPSASSSIQGRAEPRATSKTSPDGLYHELPAGPGREWPDWQLLTRPVMSATQDPPLLLAKAPLSGPKRNFNARSRLRVMRLRKECYCQNCYVGIEAMRTARWKRGTSCSNCCATPVGSCKAGEAR